jgi:hypothetical protein
MNTQEIEIDFHPHKGQLEIMDLASKHRFLALSCARRFGKSSILKILAMMPALQMNTDEPVPVAFVMPNNGMSRKLYDESLILFESMGICKNNNSQLKLIRLTNGSSLQYFSGESYSNMRGEKFHTVVVDEASLYPKLNDMIYQAILPTLSDFQGQLIMAGTPNGFGSDWHNIVLNDKFHTYYAITADNPYIAPEEIELQKSILSKSDFEREYLGIFSRDNEQAFMTEYDSDANTSAGEAVSPLDRLYLSFDFNYGVVSCIVAQVMYDRGIVVIAEHQGLTTFTLAEELKTRYAEYNIVICGDASGFSRGSAMNMTEGGELLHDYNIIKETLGLSQWSFFNYALKSNLPHTQSRSLCNLVFRNLPVYIDNSCTILHKELLEARVDDKGKLFKPNHRKSHQNDILDAFRYFIHAIFEEGYDTVKFIKGQIEINSLVQPDPKANLGLAMPDMLNEGQRSVNH